MKIAVLAALASVASISAPAAASVVYSDPGTTAEFATPGSYSLPTFNSAGGAGTIAFTIVGYNTLDGADNEPYTDNFSLSLNGASILSGAYSLGGIGNNVTNFAPAGTTSSFTYNGYNQGGTATFLLPVTLAAGANAVRFDYASQVPQGLSDEGWAISNVTVNAAVPEPATWAMMIGGIGFAGGALRRTRADRATRAFA